MKEFEILALVVTKLTEVSKVELISKSRLRPIVELRMICSAILKESVKKVTLKRIGEQMNVDHATIVYYLRVHSNLINNKKSAYKKLYDKIRNLYLNNAYMGENLKSMLLDKRNKIQTELSAIDNVLLHLENERVMGLTNEANL